jgi:hypothetical protein
MTHEPDDGPKLFSAQQLDAILRSSGRMIYYGATILLITYGRHALRFHGDKHSAGARGWGPPDGAYAPRPGAFDLHFRRTTGHHRDRDTRA